jgi:3-methyl-2-oxobutanoate hydroxymethyltransferase
MSTRPTPANPTAAIRPKVTVPAFQEKRRLGQPLVVVTAYDFPTAQIADEAGVDAILVGDSLAMVVLGHPDTLSVTMDEMLHHARAVSRGARAPLLIGDLPFLSYQVDDGEAVRNAGRFLKDGGMDAVKLEGGAAFASTVRAIVRAGIPVQGHIGLRPQSHHLLGGYKVQGRTAETARALLDDALALQDAGCFSLVLEGIPDRVAALLTERLHIPTIGIGAGPGTAGQVLVTHDLAGFGGAVPRFVKRYADLACQLRDALAAYAADVRARTFPGPEHAYSIRDDEWAAFLTTIGAPQPPVELAR